MDEKLDIILRTVPAPMPKFGARIAIAVKHAFETMACPLMIRTCLVNALCDPRLRAFRNAGVSSSLSPAFKETLRGLPKEALVCLLERLYQNQGGLKYDRVE